MRNSSSGRSATRQDPSGASGRRPRGHDAPAAGARGGGRRLRPPARPQRRCERQADRTGTGSAKRPGGASAAYALPAASPAPARRAGSSCSARRRWPRGCPRRAPGRGRRRAARGSARSAPPAEWRRRVYAAGEAGAVLRARGVGQRRDPRRASSSTFHRSPSVPPGRSTRAISARAGGASNQWKAWPTSTASTAPARDRDRLGAAVERRRRRGTRARNSASGSTAIRRGPARAARA